MSNLARRWSWKKWAPDIGENRELPGGPVLWLELATGLTGQQMAEVAEALRVVQGVRYETPDIPEGTTAEEVTAALEGARSAFFAGVRSIIATALSPYVRVFDGPHTVDGEPLATLEDYLRLVQQRADLGTGAVGELTAALGSFNSVSGPDELFSLRSSGGGRSTDAQRTAKAAPPTAGR